MDQSSLWLARTGQSTSERSCLSSGDSGHPRFLGARKWEAPSATLTPPCSSTSMKASRSEDATSATRAKTSLAAMAAVATRALVLLFAHLALILLEFPSTYSARPHVPATSQIVAGISAATASAQP